MTDKLTPARARAILVINEAELEGVSAYESNATDMESHLVYWQSRAWLDKRGLVESHADAGRLRLALTPAGRALVSDARDVAMKAAGLA